MIKRKHQTAGQRAFAIVEREANRAAAGRPLRITIPGYLRRQIRERYSFAVDDRTDKICIHAMIVFILGNQWSLVNGRKK